MDENTLETKVNSEHGEQIMPHLYRVAWWDSGEEGIVNCDVYAIDCGENVVLIDSGRGGKSFDSLKANLEYWGLWNRVSHCLITHMHRDHAGGIDQLRASEIKVLAGNESKKFGEREEEKDYTNTHYSGNIPQIDTVLNDGDIFEVGEKEFTVIYTPGHTHTCVSYMVEIDGRKCLFSGDMVMPKGETGYTGSFDFSKKNLISSLKKVLDLDGGFDALLTGHTLKKSQSEGFWLENGATHVKDTLEKGISEGW